jgi:hypothetical protein
MPSAIPIAFQIVAATLIPAGASTLVAGLIMGGASLLGAYIASQLFGSGKTDEPSKELTRNYVSTNKTVPLIYGRRLVGSNDVFIEMGSRGETETGKKKNYLWVVHALGEGEIEGISTTDVDGVLEEEIYIDGVPLWKMKDRDLVHHELYYGTSDQEYDPLLNSGSRIGKEDKFTDNMRYTAYIVFRFLYSRKGKNYFSGVPKRQVVIKGIKCYDPRSDVTEWTDNPALVLYDYITNTRYGMGVNPDYLDIPSFNEAATYCELSGWSFNYGFNSQQKAETILEVILWHFRGTLRTYAGKLYAGFLDTGHETLSMVLDNSHIARDQEGLALVSEHQPSRFDLPDGVVVGFVNESQDWADDRVNIGGLGQIKSLSFGGYTERSMAMNMGTYVLERSRLNRIVTAVVRPNALALDTNDLVHFSSTELAMTNQYMRVKSNDITADGLVSLSLIYEDDLLYDSDYNLEESEVFTVDLPSVSDEPPPVTGVVVTEETYDTRERSFIRLKIDFTAPFGYPWFSHVDVSSALGDSPPTEDDFLFVATATDTFRIDPVEENQAYTFRLNTVSTYGVKQENGNAVQIGYTVIGVSKIVPSCPKYLDVAVNLTSVDLFSPTLFDPDLSGYEVRLGTSWLSSIFITERSKPTISFSGVKPGDHTFWLNSKHKNGTYCPLPKSDSVIIEDPPPGSHLFFEQVVDYTLGIGTNIVVTGVYPNQVMTVDHSSGEPYRGEFISDVIDTETQALDEKMLIYVLAGINFSGGTGTWNSLCPPPATWYDFAYDSVEGRWKTWYEVVGDVTKAKAAIVEIGVDYSDSPTGPFDSVERLELLSTIVTGRYVKIRYKLEDINEASYIELGPSTFKAAYLEDNFLIDA